MIVPSRKSYHYSTTSLPTDSCVRDNANEQKTDCESTLLNKVVEIAFYLAFLITIFPTQMGTSGKGGAILTAVGLLCFCILRIQMEKIPISFIFILAFNASANFSQVAGSGGVPLLGPGLPELIHLASYTLIISYLVRKQGSKDRVVFAIAAVILAAVMIGGVQDPIQERLSLDNIGGGFRNANDLAYTSGLFAVALLFNSLHYDKIAKLLSWVLAFFLMFYCLETVSRGGSIALIFGVILFLVANFFSKHWLRNFIVGLLAISLCTVLMSEQIIQSANSLWDRAHDKSYIKRTNVYTLDLLRDLNETIIVGKGVDHSITSGRITAHNSFLYTHIAYGGLTAYIYLLWILWLAKGVWLSLFAEDIPPSTKLMVVAFFGMMILSHIFSNRAYIFLSSIYTVAIIEKFTNTLRRPIHYFFFPEHFLINKRSYDR